MSILRPIQFISSLLSAICLLALGWFGHSFFGGKAAPAGRAPAAIPSVAVGEIVSETFNPPEEFVGHVEPVQEVDILPQIEGYVKEVKFTEGGLNHFGEGLPENEDMVVFQIPPVKPQSLVPVIEIFLK